MKIPWNIGLWKKWYQHQPLQIRESEEAAILWYFAIQTNRKIKSYKPNTVFEEN